MKKVYCLLLCFVVFIAALGCSKTAYAGNDDIDIYFEAYLKQEGFSSFEEYLGDARSVIGLDVAFCMRRYRDGLDFSLLMDKSDFDSVSASTREKLLLYQKAFGKEVVGSKEDVYALGIMSRIFGLHLLKNDIPIEGVEKEELVSEIVSMQKTDGGWSLFGAYSDVDVTSMCLQALAGECPDAVIENALQFLSSAQQPDGTFKTMGASNCESTAQVVITLSALNIDCASDDRFIKDKSVLDALYSFVNEDLLFCHEQGGEYNERATAQALSALVAYKLYKERGEAFYFLPEYHFGQNVGQTPKTQIKANLPVNAWVSIGIAAASVLICVVMLVIKKGGWKEVVTVLVVGCALSLYIGLSTFQTVEEYYADSLPEGDVMVYVSIRKDVIDKDSPVIFSGNIGVKENASVLDAVIIVTRKNQLQLSYVTGYISSIDNLAEFSYGNESGWMFAINGVYSDKNCSEKKVKEGDKICFLYTVKMGKDISDFFEVHDEY